MDPSIIYILLCLVIPVCLTAIKCFKIKYGDSAETTKVREELAALHKKLAGIDVEAIKDLKLEVKALRNHYGLSSRK